MVLIGQEIELDEVSSTLIAPGMVQQHVGLLAI